MLSKKITIQGKEYKLTFTLGVMETIEELTGKNALTENIFADLSAKSIKTILYAYLKDEDEDITLREVGRMVGLSDFEMVIEGIMGAYNITIPKSDEPKKKGK